MEPGHLVRAAPLALVALGSWPLPLLEGGAVELPHSDHIDVVGLDGDEVGKTRDAVAKQFEAACFKLHAITGVSAAATVLVTDIGGRPARAHPA
eukprot:3058614-Pyramimonas_sp.AAC.1